MPEFGFSERKSEFKIETIKTPEGNEVSFCPERGGIITSIKLKGKEILYLDEETFLNPDVNVKGGIPVLFPNAGPVKSEKFPDLKQHGFARNSSRWAAEKIGDGFTEILRADEDTKKIYPYDFQTSIHGALERDGSFTLLQQVENLGTGREIPVSMGLHPYFRVPNESKAEIKFNFTGGDFISANIENWANGKSISIDNPKLKNPSQVIEVDIPSMGRLTMDVSPEYRKIFIWSLPDKDFICIEPFMRDGGGLVDNPEMVKPGETFSARVNLALE